MTERKERKQREIRAAQPYRDEGQRLRAFRKTLDRDLDWKRYATNAGLDMHAYRQNENGITRISVDNALSLRARYAITLDYIYAD